MPNPFSINIVTPAGAALIAQATAANQIVFTSALSGTTAATDAADLAGKTAAFYDGVAGAIASSSATGTVARVVAQFGNAAGSSPQPVKSLCILGKLASQTDGEAVIVAAMSDADSSVVLPASTAPEQAIRFPFNLSIEASEDITTVYSDGATLSDLERFVSMYKAGDPTVGEQQTILGEKRFENGATFGAGVGIEGELVVSGPVEMNDGLVVDSKASFGGTALFGHEIAISGPTVPEGEECYFNALQSINGATTTDSLIIAWPDHAADETLIELQSDKVKMEDLEAHSLYVETSVYIYQALTVEGVATFTDPIVVAASSQIKCVDGSQKVRVQVTSYGISVKNASETEIASIDTTSGIVSAAGYLGAAPSVSGGVLQVPLGGIIGVAPFGVDGWNLPREAGSEVTIAANAMPVAAWDAANSRHSAESSGRKIPAGKYRLVTGWDYSGAGSGYGLVLLCRVD